MKRCAQEGRTANKPSLSARRRMEQFIGDLGRMLKKNQQYDQEIKQDKCSVIITSA